MRSTASKLLAILVAGCLSGCSALSLMQPTVPLDEDLSGAVYYKRNVSFTINGVKGYPGSAIAPRADRYTVKVRAPGDLDFLLITTCGRAIEGARDDDEFTFELVPNAVERSRPCPLTFEGAEKGKNRSSWGWIDTLDPRHKLQAELTCNDARVHVNGVGVCESLAGIVTTRIEFPQDVVVEGSEACQVFKAVDGSERIYEALMPRGTCTINFMSRATRDTARVTLYGYDQIQPGGL